MKHKEYQLLTLRANLYAVCGNDTIETIDPYKMLASVTYRTDVGENEFGSIQDLFKHVFENYCGGMDYNDVQVKYLPSKLQEKYISGKTENAATFVSFSVIGKYNDDYSVRCEKPSDEELSEMRTGSRTLTLYDFGMMVRKVEYGSVDDELFELGFSCREE